MRRKVAPRQDGDSFTDACAAAKKIRKNANPDLFSQPLNDYGNGQRVIAVSGHRMRYCPEFSAWLVYTGSYWFVDRAHLARRAAQDALLAFSRQTMSRGAQALCSFAHNSLNSQRITAALREAQPHLIATAGQLDLDAHLLNFQNGTVDLRTGRLQRHSARDMISKIVPHAYNPHAQCPGFSKFLGDVLPGLTQYVQKALGYTLTGATSEKAVFVCHGTGNNGKTTLLSTIRSVLGEHYTALLQIDTLMSRPCDNNAMADLADLRGARFVMTSEPQEGQRLAEGRLKRITQGMGHIKTARKYENPFHFPETHKLWIDCNQKPPVSARDEAIWNRLHPIPFEVTIQGQRIDRELQAKLIAESEGILAWMVGGAVQWYSEGLGKPDAVVAAGRQWREEVDQEGASTGACVFAPNAAASEETPNFTKLSHASSTLAVVIQSYEGSPVKECLGSDGIRYLNEYHAYRDGQNRLFDAYSNRILDLKARQPGAIEFFVNSLLPYLGADFAVAVVPSHDPDVKDSGLVQLARRLCERDHRLSDVTDCLIRVKRVDKLAAGGVRSIDVHLTSLHVTNRAPIRNRDVIVLDDVTTTGNSLLAARHLLTAAGARRVILLALGRTVS
jgi:P4 family phage/plasmid primase-like protien